MRIPTKPKVAGLSHYLTKRSEAVRVVTHPTDHKDEVQQSQVVAIPLCRQHVGKDQQSIVTASCGDCSRHAVIRPLVGLSLLAKTLG